MSNLFVDGDFVAHSGKTLSWKVECDALTVEDLETFAKIISSKVKFSSVVGVPTGGNVIADALQKYCSSGPVLIVDDVLTTGSSMETFREKIDAPCIGVVLFARTDCPDWIKPVFSFGL